MPVLIRWLLVPVTALGVWYAGMVIGLVAIGLLDMFCPDDQRVSGLCVAPWYAPSVDALTMLLAGLVAFGMVVATTAAAPTHRPWIALTTYVCGAAFAGFVASGGGMRGPFIAATLGGTAGLVTLARRMRRAAIVSQP